FQQTLLEQTSRVLRRRRRVKRVGFAAALAACYAAGAWTMTLVARPQGADLPEVVHRAGDPSASAPSPKPDGDTDVSPLALEWRALDSPQKRPDLFRQAGDRYLREAGDVQSALRCYRTALDMASDEDAAVSPDDSWLLMTLKQAKQKEKRD